MLRNRLYIVFLLLAQFTFAQQVNVFNVVRTGNFNCGSAPVITAEIIDGEGSSVVDGALVITDPCGYTTLRITMNNLRYNQPGVNWPHGFFFPTGDNISVANVNLPAGWIYQTSCTGSSCSAQDTGGIGFYYDASAGSSCPGECFPTVNDGIPSNNYGQSSMSCTTPFLIAFDMTFCNSKVETTTTSFSLQGTSDGNTGCWSTPDENINIVSFSINTVESDIILFDPAPQNEVITGCEDMEPNYTVELIGGCGNDNEITWWTAEFGGTMLGSGSPFTYDAGNVCPQGTVIYVQCCPQGTDCDSRIPIVVGSCLPPSETPTFNPIPPQCPEGSNPLPPTSIEGYTGTWSPAFDPDNTTIYTFTPNAGQCATEPATLEVEIVDEIIPTFVGIEPLCQNSEAPDLPDSNEGITGTWSPSVIDTSTVGTTTYTFTSDDGQCAADASLTVTITDLLIAEFDISNQYCQGETPDVLSLMSENGISGTWSPAVIDTDTVGTTTYTFTPSDEELCTETYTLTVTVAIGIALDQINAIPLCDDNFDGIFAYDLTDIDEQLTVSTTGLTFNYYTSQINAENNNPIPSGQWNGYEFTSLPSSIWVVASNGEGCRSEIIRVDFTEGQGISLLSGPYEIPFCEGEPLNLTQFHGNYTAETGVTFAYYQTQGNAESETSPITGVTNYMPAGVGSIYIRLEKNNRCPEIIEVDFTAGQQVQHNSGTYGPIGYCEGDEIDLTQYELTMALESGITFTYYETLPNAQNETNAIAEETAYEPSGDGTVYVRLEKADRCWVILEIEYEQRPSPSIEGLEPLVRVICDGDEIEVEAGSDDSTASFLWEWGNNQSQSGPALTITAPGTYTLTVTGDNSCESREDLVVQSAAQPVITSVESGENYLIVFAQGGGGLLEYSLNGVLWQTSPRFDNLIKGELYTVYVREDGCMTDKHQVVVLDISNFVSPNGDGYNDVWEVRGIHVTPGATIRIFDRYGKIFVDTTFDGNYVWDGKYTGNPLPSGDYWYIMEVPSDGVTVAQKFVGHISIRSR